MSLPDQFPQAQHNEETCKYLLASGAYFDWVVTTAFYSALHYVQGKIFPLTIAHPETDKIVTFQNFPLYYLELKRIINCNKHEATASLVNEHLPSEIGPKYQSLMDKCMTARYNDYNVEQREADVCIRKLEKIKAACLPASIER